MAAVAEPLRRCAPAFGDDDSPSHVRILEPAGDLFVDFCASECGSDGFDYFGGSMWSSGTSAGSACCETPLRRCDDQLLARGDDELDGSVSKCVGSYHDNRTTVMVRRIASGRIEEHLHEVLA
eukprot:CAMPEP_0176120504 /NCGR_PEP_ID=MMETSP0120_2-20121206/60616_1 /TAXON_ID=160619 /ORGANISM="Kryptoperidinium foliaceum, Strain CCMP 1326" /LENGTH=122 /DNA_ID=CAMNT_0017454965 /DNA_START=8 /DNA_END=372 /DNA_ORIENTATION=+